MACVLCGLCGDEAERDSARLADQMFRPLKFDSGTRERVGDRLAEPERIKTSAEEILAQGQCLCLGDLAVNGRDVIAAGVAPGLEVGRVLRELLGRVMDGAIQSSREKLLGLIPVVISEKR